MSRDVVASFYKGLLIAFSKKIPDPAQFKECGKIISHHVKLPFEIDKITQILESDEPLKEEFVEILSVIKPYISFLHYKITLKHIILE